MSELISSLDPNAIADNSIDFSKIKAEGKVLSDNNYTNVDKEKLAGLNNYDDTTIITAIVNIEDKIPEEASSTNKLIDEASVHNIQVTLENSIATKANADDIKESGLIAELATARNGYNIKVDWSTDPTKENTIDPAFRGQVNLGAGCTTSSSWTYAEGVSNVASGNTSHAEGGYNIASGARSHAEGMYNVASGAVSHAEGGKNIASGIVSHSEGETNVASGYASHAGGSNTIASGDYSTTIGGAWIMELRLTGDAGATTYTYHPEDFLDPPDPYVIGPNHYSYIIQVGDKRISPIKIISTNASTGMLQTESTLSADATLSDTMCYMSCTVACGDYSFATRGIAAGSSSWAVNRGGFAKGAFSFVGGNYNYALNTCEVAFGNFNKSVQSSNTAVATIATIGIGADKDNRKNATEIKQNGDVYIIGIGGYDGTNSGVEGIKAVQGVVEDVNTQIKTVDDKVVALETANTELRNTISTLEARIAELESKMSVITITV